MTSPHFSKRLGLFFITIISGVLALAIYAFSASQPTGSEFFWQLREVALVLALLSLPAIAINIVILLPLGRRVKAASLPGAAICILAVGWFILVYPFEWTASRNDIPILITYTVGFFLLIVPAGAFLTKRYWSDIWDLENPRRRYLAFGMFAAAVALAGTGLGLFVSTSIPSPGSALFWQLREYAILLIILALPALGASIGVVFSDDRWSMTTVLVGVGICVIASGWFTIVYPYEWTAGGNDVPVVSTYVAGMALLMAVTGGYLVKLLRLAFMGVLVVAISLLVYWILIVDLALQSPVSWIIALIGAFTIAYYLVVNSAYLVIHILALFELDTEHRLSQWEPPFNPYACPFLPSIAILIPAYDEEQSIEETVRSALTLEYPASEVVVINDGSSDDTLERLITEYELSEIEAEYPGELPCQAIRGVYRSELHDQLYVIDKVNGGKSDALNAGVWFTDQELVCSVDADTIIDRTGLIQVVEPFLRRPDKTVATGGTIRVANGVQVEKGQIVDVKLPKKTLPGLQVMEYLRAFYSGRAGLDRFKGLILISGAFSVFKTDVVRDVGGYGRDTVTEDFDLVLSIHEYMAEEDREYRVKFVPQPVAWTEAPETLEMLFRQRARWYAGMVQNLVKHRKMMLSRKYGRPGMFGLSFFLFVEMLGPLVEGLGYTIIPIAVLLGILNWPSIVLLFLVTAGFGVFLSWFGTYSEVWTFRRYSSVKEIIMLLYYGVLENVGYRQWKAFVKWRALLKYLRGNVAWEPIDRGGFSSQNKK